MTPIVNRRDRLKVELRQEILDAARDLFANEGYQGVSIRKIAETVGCASGTIYLHFADKDAILADICRETFGKLSLRMAALAANVDVDALERLRIGGRRYIEFALDYPQHYVITFSLAKSLEDQGPFHVSQDGMTCFDCLLSLVRQSIAAGQLRFDDVDEVAQILWAAEHGMAMLLIQNASFPFIEKNRLIDSLVDMIIEGIRKK